MAESPATCVKLMGMGHIQSWVARIAMAVVAITCVSCGSAVPLQVADATITGTGVGVPPATQTAEGTPVLEQTESAPTELAPTTQPTQTPGPSPTPNMQATSAAVFATITALAASPTYPPTSTPRPYRTPISAGPDLNNIPPTALYVSGGIGVLTLSAQVVPGGAGAVTIKAKPAAVCTLKVDRSTANAARFEPIPGAATQVTGRDGVAAWIWSVDASEPAGIMRLLVDCGNAGTAQLQLKVIN